MVETSLISRPTLDSGHDFGSGGVCPSCCDMCVPACRGPAEPIHSSRTRTWNFQKRGYYFIRAACGRKPLISLFGFSVGGLLSGSLLGGSRYRLAWIGALAAGVSDVQRSVCSHRGGDVINPFHDFRNLPGGHHACWPPTPGSDAIGDRRREHDVDQKEDKQKKIWASLGILVLMHAVIVFAGFSRLRPHRAKSRLPVCAAHPAPLGGWQGTVSLAAFIRAMGGSGR